MTAKRPLVLPAKNGRIVVLSAANLKIIIKHELLEPDNTMLLILDHNGVIVYEAYRSSPYLGQAIKLACAWIAEHA